MNRKILFRGYNLKNKKWLYGYYLADRGQHFIVHDEIMNPFPEPEDFEVDPESVGQYVTTIKDVDLYEGDYVYRIKKNYYDGEEVHSFSLKCHVKYDKEMSGILLLSIDDRFAPSKSYIRELDTEDTKYFYKVIGNEYEEKNNSRV